MIQWPDEPMDRLADGEPSAFGLEQGAAGGQDADGILFAEPSQESLEIGGANRPPAFLVEAMELDAGALRGATGTVHCEPEFDGV
jgi:hypothetical protein